MSDKGEWISVEDEMPEGRAFVLGWAPPGYIALQYCVEDSSGRVRILDIEDEDWQPVVVTHWQPMPQPPEVDDLDVDKEK